MRQLKEYGKSAGIITTIQCDPVIERVRLAPEIEIALFRIAQEAVNNVIRHSGASTIDIDLVRYKQKLVMAIVDNGAGFDIKAEEGKGLGLSSIKDRANAIAAKLTVSSEPGETRIEVSVKTEFKETNQKEEQ
jgi:signal transduction histidine kinase